MKKTYVSLSLNVTTFDETDVVRTSRIATVFGFSERDVDFADYFGGAES